MDKEKVYYAHSSEDESKKDWQRLDEHLIAVGKLASFKARYFGAAQVAEVAGLLHDIGKYTAEFQARLEGSNARVNHSTWGAILAEEKYGPIGKLISYCIAGHHAGLANGVTKSTKYKDQATPLSERLKAQLPLLNKAWESEIRIPPTLAEPQGFSVSQSELCFQYSFLIRMIFSCLVDSDFIDTESFYVKINNDKKNIPPRGDFPSLEALNEQFSQYMADFPPPKTEINKLRNQILNTVTSHYSDEPGVFSLNVPTGGGKTLTSMSFALKHALEHGLRRIIYVIPFTSIIEQNAKVFKDAFGTLGEQAVLEHHSAFSDEKVADKHSLDKLKLAAENWEAPIIVTTAVQFFESLFAARTSKCRKLHNISGSVVIFDEVQVMPLNVLRPCVAAMQELVRNYSVSAVLCTATQPALKAEDGFKSGFENVIELAPEPQQLHEKLERFKLINSGKLSDDDLISQLENQSQVLCIVNSRKHAKFLYDKLSSVEHTFHLTTLMCAEHRTLVIEEIKSCLEDERPCIVIATSLIEAGVDLDFPLVYRAEAGLDSLIQAGGRCNRNGKLPAESCELRVFQPADEWKAPPELTQFAQATRAVLRKHQGKETSLEAITDYFREVYWQRSEAGSNGLDSNGFMKMFEDRQLQDLPFETVANHFHMIESNMMPVLVPFDKKSRELIDSLQYAEHTGAIARKLQRYVVQIPQQALQEFIRTKLVYPVAPHKFGEQFMVLSEADKLYHEKSGLDLEGTKAWQDKTLAF